MQVAAPWLTLSLVDASCGYPLFVHSNHAPPTADLAVHSRLRKSRTRPALPSERGTPPDDLTVTSQVTPISDLMCALTSRALRSRAASSEGASGASSTSSVIASSAPSRVSTI